jgi:hypothetical protein
VSRPDLLTLTPEAVASLTNLGLVKRAQREIGAGHGPTLQESEDGTVLGTFADGTQARLPPGVPLRDAPCSCGAATVCRHRVAVALAYSAWRGEEGPESSSPALPDAWSPGTIDDAALEEALGRRTLDRARLLRRRGCDVEVRRVAESVGAVPEVRLPTCGVRFLVPRDLAYARCECALGHGCEHIAIAVWAFRAADAAAAGPIAALHVGEESEAPDLSALASAVALCREILLEGVVNLTPSFAGKLAHARQALEAAGFTWPGTAVDDIEEQVDAYRLRSARYSAWVATRLLVEMAARARAVRGRGALPARTILGVGEARETPLAHVRLVSLGVRVTGGERERLVDVFLADPSTGIVVTLRKAWTYAEGEAVDDGQRLGDRSVVAGVRLHELARGQVVTHAAKRLANRLVKLGAARKGTMSVTPQAGDWRDLPMGLVIEDMAAYLDSLKQRSPQLLRPRILAESLHVVRVKDVSDIHYRPGEQALVATVVTESGFELTLRRTHRGAAPKALEVLANGLGGRYGSVHCISGNLFAARDHLEIDPVSVLADRLVLLDLEDAEMPDDVAVGAASEREHPLHHALQDAWTCLEQAAHAGLNAMTPAWTDRLGAVGDRLVAVGLSEAADRCRRLGQANRRRMESRNDPEAESAAARAWEDAAIRVLLTQEVSSQGD